MNEKQICFPSNSENRLDNDEHSLFDSFARESLLKNTSSLFLADQNLSPTIYQLPILLRKTNSIDVIYEKCVTKIDFKYGKIQSNSHNGIHLIGKQVRIKSNSSLSRKLPAMNSNNNCYESDNSRQSRPEFSSTSNDSLTSFESGILDNTSVERCTVLPANPHLLLNCTESGRYVHLFAPICPMFFYVVEKLIRDCPR